MRKFWFVPALVLVVIAVSVFLGGWLQLVLGRDTWGVVHTRSHGFESTPVDPAGFTWRWERIVPRMLTLYRIPVTQQRVEIPVIAPLPSGDVYASLMPEKPDFSVQATVSVLYVIRPSALSGLVEDGLREQTLADWHRQVQAGIREQAGESAISLVRDPGDLARVSTLLSGRLQEVLGSRLPWIHIISVNATVERMPDPDLYGKLKASYLRLADQKGAAMAALAPRVAAAETAARAAIERHDASMQLLTRYGELLDKYPSLIKFLFIATAGKLSARDLENLDLLDKLPSLE